jgi:hypothetical protein
MWRVTSCRSRLESYLRIGDIFFAWFHFFGATAFVLAISLRICYRFASLFYEH